jgi:hypothetical protein
MPGRDGNTLPLREFADVNAGQFQWQAAIWRSASGTGPRTSDEGWELRSQYLGTLRHARQLLQWCKDIYDSDYRSP